MKKFMTIASLFVLLLATATSALASGEAPQERFRGRTPFALAGTISSIGGTTITIQVVNGNRLVKPFIGEDLAVKTTDATRFLLKNSDGTVSLITLADLAVGQNVSVSGVVKPGSEFVARRITVGARLIHLP